MSRACPLCSDPPLAQAASHFESWWWEASKREAQEAIQAARARIKKADAHLRMTGATASGT